MLPLTGFTYQSTFIIELRSATISSSAGSPATAASIVLNPKSNAKSSFGQIQIDSTQTYIFLTADRVKTIVRKIFLLDIFLYFASAALSVRF